MDRIFSRTETTTDVWLTPPEILQALGDFDLDPCAVTEPRPWPTARQHMVEADNGLAQPWAGRVWLNPPYGNETKVWLKRLAEHTNGIALVFARLETQMFFDYVWPKASGILFFKGRINFYKPDGSRSSAASAPSCLVAYGPENAAVLAKAEIDGVFFDLQAGRRTHADPLAHLV